MAAKTPILPVSGTPLLSNPQARVFFSKISESTKNAMYYRRPWLELVDHSAFSKPESLGEATARIRKNWGYFRINYLVLLCAAVALSLLSHPLSLFLLLVMLGGWLFLYFFRSEPLVVYNRLFTDREILGILLVVSIVIVFWTDVLSVIIYAVMAGLAIICAHGALRAPEDLFLEEQPASTSMGGAIMSFAGNVPSIPIRSAVASYV